MIRRPTRSTRTDTLFPTRRSSDLAGMGLKRRDHHLRQDLEAPPADRAIAAPAMIEEAVFIDHRQIGGANPVIAHAGRFDLQQSFLARRNLRQRVGIDDAQPTSGPGTAAAAEFGAPDPQPVLPTNNI